MFILLLGLSLLASIVQPINAQDHTVRTVVIDAGHGGKDPGNLGTKRYKTQEKDISLAVALLVGKYIEENLRDVTVIYTRKTDVFVELEKRAQIANDAKADLFISIHCDAFSKSSVSGATSIVMGLNHADDNLRVALRENSVIELEDNYEERYEGFDPNDPSSYIAFTLYQSEFLEQSVSMAQKVQNQFRDRVHRKDRGVKQQPLMVTKMAIMPAVLIELGFLTNPKEEDYLNSSEGQAFMASAIYRAFKEYKQERDQFQVKVSTKPEEAKPSPAAKSEALTPAPATIEKTPAVVPPATTPATTTTATKSASTTTKPASTAAAATKPSTSTTKTTTPATKQTTPPAEVKTETKTEPEASDPKVYLAVQILTSSMKKDVSPKNFGGLEGVTYYREKDLYKYKIGQALTLATANVLKEKAVEAGYKDAFIIGLVDGKRVTVAEALKLLE